MTILLLLLFTVVVVDLLLKLLSLEQLAGGAPMESSPWLKVAKITSLQTGLLFTALLKNKYIETELEIPSFFIPSAASETPPPAGGVTCICTPCGLGRFNRHQLGQCKAM